MRVPRIYYHDRLINGNTYLLPKTTSHHLLNVLRARIKQPLKVFDGQGHEFHATLTAINNKQAEITTGEPIENHTVSPIIIHLGQAMVKGDKMDFIIQKAVELGVTDITPLSTERCDSKLNPERMAKKLNHWRKVAISACEQCGRHILPTINKPSTITDWFSQQSIQQGFILSPTATQRLRDQQLVNPIYLLIGPEGGLSKDEINVAKLHNFTAITLGPRILRTETASLTVISVLQSMWGDV